MTRSPLDSGLDPLEGNLVRVFHRDRQTGVWTYYDGEINPGDRARFRLAPGQEYWIKAVRDQRVSHHMRETWIVAGWNVVIW